MLESEFVFLVYHRAAIHVKTSLGHYYYYCVVLYLFICIALLAVHTNQRRFQCETLREESSLEKTKRHLAHQLIKWIV